MTRSRFTMRANIGAVIVMVLTGAAIAALWSEVAGRERLVGDAYRQVTMGDDRPVAPANALRAALARSPVDQRLLNQWVVEASASGQPRERLLELLDAGGYRYTPAQLNLILGAFPSQDVASIVRHLDALYRRDEAREKLAPMIAVLEQAPATRRQIVDVLATDPIWRASYMRDPAPLASPAGIAARRQTLEALAARGKAVRWEMQYASQQALLAGNAEAAFAIWRAAGSTARAEGAAFPFEWSVPASHALDGTARMVGAGTRIEVNWDGFGAPILVRRFASTAQPDWRVVTLGKVEGYAPEGLAMRIRCRNGQWLPMTRESDGALLRFSRAGMDGCAVVEQVVVAEASSNIATPLSFEIYGQEMLGSSGASDGSRNRGRKR